MKTAILLAVLVLSALTGACTSSPTAPRAEQQQPRMDVVTDSLTTGGHTVGSGG